VNVLLTAPRRSACAAPRSGGTPCVTGRTGTKRQVPWRRPPAARA